MSSHRQDIWGERLDDWCEVIIQALWHHLVPHRSIECLKALRDGLGLKFGEYYYIQYEDRIRFRCKNVAITVDVLDSIMASFRQYGYVSWTYISDLKDSDSQGEYGHIHPVYLVKWSSHIALETGRPFDREELKYLLHVIVENQFYKWEHETGLYREIYEDRSRDA